MLMAQCSVDRQQIDNKHICVHMITPLGDGFLVLVNLSNVEYLDMCNALKMHQKQFYHGMNS